MITSIIVDRITFVDEKYNTDSLCGVSLRASVYAEQKCVMFVDVPTQLVCIARERMMSRDCGQFSNNEQVFVAVVSELVGI